MDPLPFDPPEILRANRVTGLVVVPNGDENAMAHPLDLGWNASSRALDVSETQGPPALRRRSSLSGNILVVHHPEDGEISFFLQRKLIKTTHGSVRVGFRVENCGEEDDVGIEWDVVRSDGTYPFEMFAVKLQEKARVMKGAKHSSMKDPRDELSALQLIARCDPKQQCHVVSAKYVGADRNTVFTIMPFSGEGSLFDYVLECGYLDEPIARHCFKQILKGLKTLKDVGVCHRNLTLENVLLRGTDCMISDLGSSIRTARDGARLKPELVFGGNPKYLAPELVKNESFDGHAVDLWAAAVILCGMLFGTEAPFVWASREDRRYVEICIKGNLRELSSKWTTNNPNKKAKVTPVSDEALDLIQNMLRADPKERLDLQAVMDHPWLEGAARPPVLAGRFQQ